MPLYQGTFSSKRPYDDQPQLLVLTNPFYFRIGYSNESMFCLVQGKSGTFGDVLPYELAGLNIKFNVYNQGGVLVCRKNVLISNLETSELEVEWQATDFKVEGYYTGEFIFTDINGKEFILPRKNNRIQIVCK